MVARGVLKRANDIWHEQHPYEFYGGSYKAMDPWTYFDQKLGLIISSALSSHLLLAHSKNKSKQPKECACEETPCPAQFPHPDDDDIFYDAIDEDDCCCCDACNADNDTGNVSTGDDFDGNCYVGNEGIGNSSCLGANSGDSVCETPS